MKQWSKPQLNSLSIKYTEAGGLGSGADGVYYQVRNQIVIGTSGQAITDPRFVPIPPQN